MAKRFLLPIAGALCLLVAATALQAQTTGKIRGDVKDSDGNAIEGATISVAGETLLGGDRIALTGPTGDYRFTGVPVGEYSVTAAMDSFQSQSFTGVQVSINATVTVEFILTPEFAEQMIVSGEAPLVDLTSSSVGSTYNEQFIKDLPTNRNFYDMMAVSPGVSQDNEGSDRQIAFGSNMQSNGWYIDGIDTSAPETGSSWWYINPDTVAEIQVLGIGAPAEFGNMLGAAFNVVTKSGTNTTRGTFNAYWQDDSLTDSNFRFPNSQFPEFHRDKFYDVSATLGGPFKRDKLWYYAAAQTWRDGSTQPGVDPSFTPLNYADRFDLKLSASLNPQNQVDVKLHYEDWGYPFEGNAFVAPSALGGEAGENPAGAVSWQSILSDRTYLEVKYAGWWSDDVNESQTGSREPAFIDYSPPGGGPPVYTGGLWYPWTYETWRQQIDVATSHFADDFLKGDHDFKFGVQYNEGSAETVVSPSATGVYYYHYAYDYYGYIYDYFYRVEGNSYFYGAEQESWGAFVDDSWAVNERLTVNLGVRFDRHEGRIPPYPRLDLLGNPTGETIPGVDPAFTWSNFSPRFGFAYNAGEQKKTVVRGSAGVYYDGNVSGNWDYPPPQHPGLFYYAFDPTTGASEFAFDWFPGATTIDPDLKAPRTLQYALGFEREFKNVFSVGAQAIYKDTKDLVGWEILGDGVFEPVPFTDPFTGQQYTLLNQIVAPTVRKGNKPGFTANPNATKYYQEYSGLILTFKRRRANGWDLMASYTLSESKGLIPRMLSQRQFNPFYSSREGTDPNNFINADQLLQGDRRNMLRAQANFSLPWNLHASAAINIQDGRAHNRQIRVPLDQGLEQVIMEPANDSSRYPSQTIVDLSIGKRVPMRRDGVLKADVQLFNVLNDDANDFWETLVLQSGDSFVPTDFILPRRVMLRLGVEF